MAINEMQVAIPYRESRKTTPFSPSPLGEGWGEETIKVLALSFFGDGSSTMIVRLFHLLT